MSAYWPKQPYKGLNYYGREDAPIFAGRDADIRRCAKLLGVSSTKVVILHGATGCGKSSFLRAGLIPLLEGGWNDFQFLKAESDADKKAFFVRSTDDPLSRLIEVILDFASSPYVVTLADGAQESINLSPVVQNVKDEPLEMSRSPEPLSHMLTAIAKLIPRTLVLVIDQAEEVLTINPDHKGDLARQAFFGFLADFSKRRSDIKLVVSLRTEYYGRFFHELRASDVDEVSVRDYLLTELDSGQIQEAIMRPTLLNRQGNRSSPRDVYGFTYEVGLPELIAKDIRTANVEGGVLPVLQLVCLQLYRTSIKRDKKAVIQVSHYRKLKNNKEIESSINGANPIVLQVGDHLDISLREAIAAAAKGRDLNDQFVEDQLDIWYEILGSLVKKQVDGTTTTQLQTNESLRKLAAKLESKVKFDLMMDFLASESERIVTRLEIRNNTSRRNIKCYSLGHDALGLAIDRRIATESVSKKYRRLFRRSASSSVLLASVSALLSILAALGGQFFEVTVGKGFEVAKSVTVLSLVLGVAGITIVWVTANRAIRDPERFLGLTHLLMDLFEMVSRLLGNSVGISKKRFGSLSKNTSASQKRSKSLKKKVVVEKRQLSNSRRSGITKKKKLTPSKSSRKKL